MSEKLIKESQKVFMHMAGLFYEIKMNTLKDVRVTAHWGKIGLSNYHFPWNRAFEIDMDISVDPLTR